MKEDTSNILFQKLMIAKQQRMSYKQFNQKPFTVDPSQHFDMNYQSLFSLPAPNEKKFVELQTGETLVVN